MKEKIRIVAIVMGQDCEKTIGLCLESVKDADAIVFCDGGSVDNTLSYIIENTLFKEKQPNIIVINNPFNQSNPLAIPQQKNFWLNYLKKNYNGWWCIYLDSDEILEDDGIKKLRVAIEEQEKISKDTEVFAIRMRHLVYDLIHEDATNLIHQTPGRVFKITDKLYFPKSEHTFVEGGKFGNHGFLIQPVIWHLAYCEGIWAIKKRYDGQKVRRSEKSHTNEFLEQWKNAHLFGGYPNKTLNPADLPSILLKEFGIEKDSLYFANRGLEVKHFLMAKQWIEYFDYDDKNCDFIEFGCGKAPYGYAIGSYGYDYLGFEMSEYAVKNAFKNSYIEVQQGDITNITNKNKWKYRVALCVDVLEHLNDEELDKALKNILTFSDNFLFSIPFEGDPNLLNDNTHKQFHDKQWWIDKIESYRIKIVPTPNEWLFKEQILIGEKCQ